jgi:deazaflavin-dependent oxidoreductase (nitroreductase family)
MDVREGLGLGRPRRSVTTRALQWLGSRRAGAWVFARTLHRVDGALLRLSDGRWTLTETLAGLPTVVLTTTGARTGKARARPVVAVVTGEQVAVIGSNYGRPMHPGWVHNLAAEPRASVSRGRRTVPVVAREAGSEEAEAIWEAARAMYRGFRRYPEWPAGRTIRVFVLEPRKD